MIIVLIFSLDYNHLSDGTVPLLIEVIQTLKNLEKLSWVISILFSYANNCYH